MNASAWQAIRITVVVAVCAVAISLPIATTMAWLLAKVRFPGKVLVETAINLPLVLPPVVTGYLLLIAFGRHGYCGNFLEQICGLRFVFDWKGAVLASAVVGFPLLVRPIRQAFEAIDDRMLFAAQSLGASPADTFLSIALPLSYPGIMCGSSLALARSMGEFGATIMLAGNIAGQTRTIPLYVYTQLDSPGGIHNAWPVVGVSIVISASTLLVAELLERKRKQA